MKTFQEYLDNKRDQELIHECAELMVANETSLEFIEEAFRNFYPDEHQILTEAGFWSNFLKGAKNAGSTMWQGAKTAGAQFKDAVSGPQAQYDRAIGALTKLQKQISELSPNIEVQPGTPLKNWLHGLIQALDQQRVNIPQMVAKVSSRMKHQGYPQGTSYEYPNGRPSSNGEMEPEPI